MEETASRFPRHPPAARGIHGPFSFLAGVRHWTGLMLCLALAACATTSRQGGDRLAAWAGHRAMLAGLEHWNLQGRIALRSARDAWQARLVWRQQGERFEIDVLSPFGRQLARLRGGEDGVLLTLPKGERHRAGNVDELLRRRLGWRLPVAGLRHWVLGLPAPGPVERRVLDAAGRLRLLAQAGWSIDYDHYREDAGLALPTRMTLRRGELRLRLVVDRWTLAGPG